MRLTIGSKIEVLPVKSVKECYHLRKGIIIQVLYYTIGYPFCLIADVDVEELVFMHGEFRMIAPT